jgi:hypothetical protein
MHALSIKTDAEAIIEIERNSHGIIFIRHSQFQPKEWAELHEDKRPASDGHIPKLGGYIIIGGREFQISGNELESIKDAVKNQDGNVPPIIETTLTEDERHATNELVSVVLTVQQYLANLWEDD